MRRLSRAWIRVLNAPQPDRKARQDNGSPVVAPPAYAALGLHTPHGCGLEHVRPHAVTPVSVAVFAAIFAALYFGRREFEHDSDGNPVVRPGGWVFACLVIALFFAGETWSKMDDPFHKRHPENLYLLGGFALFALAAAVGLHFTRVTLRGGRVIEHMPLFWHKELPVSDIRSVEDEGKVTVLRFKGGQNISLVHMFSGVPGFLQALRRNAPRLGGGAGEI